MIPERVCAIITAYNSGAEIAETVRSVRPQVGKVLVVDDQSEANHFAQIESTVRGMEGVALIRNPLNYGLGRSLNIGVQHAVRENYEWVLTLDDNSYAEPHMIEKMFAAYHALPSVEQDRIAAIAPNYTTLKGSVHGGKEPFPILTTITAGQLLKTSVWQAIGGFNEDLIIGAIDHDFAFRALRAGYKILLVPSAVLEETPGPAPIVRSLFGKKFVVPNYSPKRYYYIYRNDIYLYKNYFGIVPGWIIRNIGSNIASFIKIILFEPHAWEKTRMIARGCWDGLRSKLGKLD